MTLDARIPLQAVARPVNVLAFNEGFDAMQKSKANALAVQDAETGQKMKTAQMLAKGVLGADDKAGAYALAREQAGRYGMDVSALPEQWGPEADAALRMVAIDEDKRTALMRNLESMGLAPGSEEYRDAAMRALGVVKDPKPANDPTLIREIEAAGFKRGTPEFMKEYARRTAKSGRRIQVGANGEMVIAEGPGVGSERIELGRSARNETEKNVVGNDELKEDFDRLREVAGVGPDGKLTPEARERFTYVGRAKAAGANFLEKLGFEAGDEYKEMLQHRTRIQQVAGQAFNKYRKDITGAAAAVQELDRLLKTFVNPDMGPTEFEVAFDEYTRKMKRISALHREFLRLGIDATTKEGGKKFDEAFATGNLPEGNARGGSKPLKELSDDELRRLYEGG